MSSLSTVVRRSVNTIGSKARLALGAEAQVVTVILHTIYNDMHDAQNPYVDTFQPFTTDQLDELITRATADGYRFITPDELCSDPPGDRLVLLTFDDGYFNNFNALPVLNSHEVPATFYISAGHVRDGRSYWWDAMARAGATLGWDQATLWSEDDRLKKLPYDEIEATIRERFGDDALVPVGDLDRPMTPDELVRFASDPCVVIGNHTVDHAILDVLDLDQVQEQIQGCQQLLHDWLGYAPTSIAYPNGNVNDAVAEVARSVGLTTGFSTEWGAEPLPLAATRIMRVPRIPPTGASPIGYQWQMMRAPGLRR